MKRVVGLSLVAAGVSLAAMGWLAWRENAPIASSQENEAYMGRIAAKTEVIDRLRGGELTLLQAAAAFRDLHAEGALSKDQPGDSDAEQLCRQVIEWASMQESETAARELAQRLEDELDEHLLDNDGGVVLPG